MQDRTGLASGAFFVFARCSPTKAILPNLDFRHGASWRNMIDRKPHRNFRELTAGEREILQAARADAEAERESILEQAREAKNAWQETRQVVDVLIAKLKAERERQALSLADVEERTGIRRSVLSRLENDATSNPTMLTLQRYAVALGLSLRAELMKTH